MKFILLGICLIFTSYSCNIKKTYKYVLIIDKEDLFGEHKKVEEKPEKIKAVSDSAAYLEAYLKYTISVKANKNIEQATGKVFSTPRGFDLYNNKGKEISQVDFKDKKKKEEEIEKRIFLMSNPFKPKE